MSRAADDSRVQRILEACYDAICAGSEPDLTSLCQQAPELRAPVERMLQRERELLQAVAGDARSPLPELPSLPPRLADFSILEPIGIGGMSHVFRARQEPLGREVALKVLRDDLVRSTTGRLRFAREATITASLEHPHIVPVYAAGEADGRVFLAMKLLRGRSLDQRDGPMSPAMVARIGIDVGSALQSAHDVGVVHRDLKPANIVVENGHAYVVDFGLAAFAHQASMLTQPNSTPGTLIYLPPEVARRQASGLDPRADVYGLGVTLYEILAGEPPFDASNPVRALQQVLHQEPKPLGLTGSDRDLETIVLRAMDKVPQRRFQSAAELADELHRYANGQPIRTKRPNAIVRGWRAVKRHRTTSALVAVLLLLATALSVQTVWQHRADRASLAQRVAAARSALHDGQLVAASRQLEDLADHPLAGTAVPELTAHWQRERDLQVLIATLQHPIARNLNAFVDDLVARVAKPIAGERHSPRRAAALQIAHCYRGSAATAATQASFDATALPRTAAALDAWRDGGDIRAALAALGTRTGGRTDHLLGALVLRCTNAPERVVERELRRAGSSDEPALVFDSLRIALEAQGRHREAYDVARQLLAHPVCQVTARWAAARLAATSGRLEAARDHLRAALGQATADPMLQLLAAPSELQVLSEYSSKRFWPRWHAAPEACRQLPQYWRMAGYVAADDDSDEQLARARSYFERGLTCATTEVQRAGLEVALLQLRWRRLSLALDATANVDETSIRPEMRTLAIAAERLIERCAQHGLPRTVLGDALVAAAQARAMLGQHTTARSHFDRAADLGYPKGLAEFAWGVAARCGQALLDDRPAREYALAEEAPIALERARRVLSMHERGLAVDEFLLASARDAALLCAAYVGDAGTALPIAATWHAGDEPNDAAIGSIADAVHSGGGIWLDRLEADPDRRCRLLLAAVLATERAWRAGSYSDIELRAVIDSWRKHPSVERHLDNADWQPLWQAIDELVHRAQI